MIKFETEREVIDYLVSLHSKLGTLEFCKKCAKRGFDCCKRIKPKCEFLSDNGCSKRKIDCLLYICNKLRANTPGLFEYLNDARNDLKYYNPPKILRLPAQLNEFGGKYAS